MLFNAAEKSKEFLLKDESAILELKKIVLAPLFEWKQPTEWGTVLAENNLFLQIDCIDATGKKVSPSPISIHASPMHYQPIFELSQPFQLPDYAWEGVSYKKEFPIKITISLISKKKKIDFDVAVIYDEE